jgi:hypothetical protein
MSRFPLNLEQLGLPRDRAGASSIVSLRDKHNLAGGAGFKDFFVGARGLRERQFFADDGAESAIFKARDETSVDFSFFSGSNGP